METDAFVSLVRTADLLLSEVQRLLKPHGLSSPLYNVLRILRGAGAEGLPCREIADRMINRDPDITRLVDRLVKLGFAERHRPEQDRRVVRVLITDEGQELLAALDGPMASLHEEQLGHLGTTRLEQLVELLDEARQRSTQQ